MVPVDSEQMDNATRPYFIHHRNQVGINTSLMDLFRLIDLFLREDEEAREPLRALQIISDYVQRRHIVAPMPSELVNFYDDPHTAAESVATGQNPLAELSHLLAPLTASTAYPTSTTRQARAPQSTMGVSMGLNHSPDGREPVFSVPLGMSSPSRPARVDLSLAFGDMPTPNLHRDQVLPLRATSTMAATDHRSALVVDVIREKLRSWLRRPDTGALKRWVLKKRQRFQAEDESWQFVNEYPTDPWAGVAHRAGAQAMEGNPETSSISAVSFEPTPTTFPHGGIQITRDIVMHSDPLPSERRRSFSISMARPLPPAPSQGESREASSNSGGLSSTNGHTRSQSDPVGASRTRRNPSAAPFQGSNSNSVAGSSILQSLPTVVHPPRVRRASLRERATSALFSTKSDSSSTDPSLQAHLQAQLYSARFVAGISTPRPVLVPQPISTAQSTTSAPRKALPKRVLPPQIRLEMGQNADLPSITIQPPSRPQTLSTPSVVADPINPSTSSSEAVYRSLSSSPHSPRTTPDAKLFRNSTYYADPYSGPTNDAENSSPLQRRGSHGTNATSHRQETYESTDMGNYAVNTVEDGQDDNGVSPLDSEEEEYESTTHSVHHGLPTPKSVESGGRLPATTPVVSLHENTSIPHHLQASGLTEATSNMQFQRGSFDSREDTCIIGPDGRAAPLVSRFSLDSHFTVSSGSTRGTSLENNFNSLSEATSREGEFMAQLASRRKRAIRSGTSRPTRRAPSLLVSHQAVPEEDPITQHSPKTPNRVSSPLRVGESSRSPRVTCRSGSHISHT